jgi:hypothetical protein
VGAIVPIIFTVIPIGLVLLLVWRQGKQIGELDRLAATGTPARGLVLQVAPQRTGRVAWNGRSFEQRSVVLEVEIPGQAPYEISLQPLIPQAMARNVLPGATIDLRVDPANPQNIAIVLPGGFSPAFVGAPGPAPAGFAPAPSPGVPRVRVSASGSPVLFAVMALVIGGGAAAAFMFTAHGEDDAPEGGWCKAAATCCKAAGGTAAACGGYKGMSGEACKKAYEPLKKAAVAAGKKCR